MCEFKKLCGACLQEKLIIEFYRNLNSKDGYERRCKVCHKNKKLFLPKTTETMPNEEIKLCRACGCEKSISAFNKDRTRKDGIREKCRQCQKDKVFIIKNIQLTGKLITCRACFEEKDLSYFYKTTKGYESKCADCHKQNKNIEKEVLYFEDQKKCSKCNVFKPFNQFYKANTTKSKVNIMPSCIDCKKQYNIDNREKLAEGKRRYINANRDLINEKERIKLKTNSFYKLKKYLRISIKHNLLNQNKKSKKTEEILGCSFEEFKRHIESQFLNWMNWDNYGNVCGTDLEYKCSWDLDHIIPLDSEITEEGLLILSHWSNYQPLCSKINRDIKRAILYPVTNLELKITKYEK